MQFPEKRNRTAEEGEKVQVIQIYKLQIITLQIFKAIIKRESNPRKDLRCRTSKYLEHVISQLSHSDDLSVGLLIGANCTNNWRNN